MTLAFARRQKLEPQPIDLTPLYDELAVYFAAPYYFHLRPPWAPLPDDAPPAPTDRWGSSRKPAAETASSESPAASSGGAYKPPGAGGAYRPPGRR